MPKNALYFLPQRKQLVCQICCSTRLFTVLILYSRNPEEIGLVQNFHTQDFEGAVELSVQENDFGDLVLMPKF
jgi:hypothetical protein